ncbi:MAG TPA: PKD domain-containing protein [Bryobacteraceae bacterium]
MRCALRTLLLCSVGVAVLSAAARAASDPILVDLNVGESQQIQLPGLQRHVLRLVSYKESTVPYFSSALHKIVPAIVSATTKLTLDGKPFQLAGGPYRMPTRVGDLNLLLILTKPWAGGLIPDRLLKDVRLEVQRASLPWVDIGKLHFPIRNYRWRASNYQHTYLGIVAGDARVYYHRGEDLGMIPDIEQALAIADGVIIRVPGLAGDGASNGVFFDNGPLSFMYDHMNAPHIRTDLRAGMHIKAGEVLGLTGNTWDGHPVSNPHLHISVRDERRWVFYDSFPFVVAAYRETYANEVLPVAGSPYYCYAGDLVKLDGKLSLPPRGSKLVRYQWKFTDGTSAGGPVVRRRYPKLGTYSEQLMVTDASGHSDSDFAEVYVLSKDQPGKAPYIGIRYYPVRPIHINEPVQFRVHYSRVKIPSVDFGDGTHVSWSKRLEHAYSKPGTYVVTVHGADSGAGPGIVKVRVVVEK